MLQPVDLMNTAALAISGYGMNLTVTSIKSKRSKAVKAALGVQNEWIHLISLSFVPNEIIICFVVSMLWNCSLYCYT